MTTSNQEASTVGSKSVRMFYDLVLIHDIAIPQGASVLNEQVGPALEHLQWELFDALGLQHDASLGSTRFQFAFDEKAGARPCNEQKSSYFVPFLVSTIHHFKPDDLVQAAGSSNFSIKAEVFTSVQNALAKEIRQLLPEKVSVHELNFSMATSRFFMFEIYYEGNFSLKREFSDQEIKSGGGVKEVLSDFFDDIKSAIEPFGFDITSIPPIHRRSRDDEYQFGFCYAPNVGFNESEVHGDGCYAVRGDASTDELNQHGVDFEDVRFDDAKTELMLALEENLPTETNLISCDIFYIDDSAEILDIDDELLPLDNNVVTQ